jgi:transposase
VVGEADVTVVLAERGPALDAGEPNHALYMRAMVQVRRPSAGQAYFQRKLAEGKSAKEALRCLKRWLSDAVYRCLLVDQHEQRCPAAATVG